MPPEKEHDPDLEPRKRESLTAGLVLGSQASASISLLPDEADYLARVVGADYQRMIEARDHGVSHGMRGYSPPDLERAGLLLHSLSMARTAATIEAIEALEEERQDREIPAGTR